MTLEEYYSKSDPQPISNELTEDGKLYRICTTIDFIEDEDHYAKIFIAHPDYDLWSFGYEIKDGNARAIIRRDPSPYAVMLGKVDKLIYGMTKVLERCLNKRNSKTIWNVVRNAMLDGDGCYVTRNYKTPKITI